MKSYICCHIVQIINSYFFYHLDDTVGDFFDGDNYCTNTRKGIFLK